jgi:flagellar protein FliL
MAEQHQPTDDDLDGDLTDPEEGEKSSKRSGKTFLVIIGAVLVAALGIGGASAYFFFPQAYAMMGDSEASDEDAPPELIEYGEFMELSGLIVNPAGTGGRRHLMVSVGLEGEDAEVLEAVTSKEVVVRDKILAKLGILTVDQLSDISLRDSIKLDILADVNSMLEDHPLSRLYFTAYVLQ